MSISCYVSWTTDVPASSEVDFGDGSYQFRIRDATFVTSHRVLVIGMHAETTYALKAVSAGAHGSVAMEGTFTTGSLPADLPTPALTASDFAHSQPGWTLMNIEINNDHPSLAVMYDEYGLPVWYFVNGTHSDNRGDIDTQFLRATNTILVGPSPGEPPREVDLSGQVVWEQELTDFVTSPNALSHCFSKTSAGDYLVNVDVPNAAMSDSNYINDQIVEEVAPDASILWSWRLLDHVAPAGTRAEMCHGNAFTLDEEGDVLYYNCRFLGLFKIDRATGSVVWRLGGTYDTTSAGPGDFTFDPPSSQFSDTHDPELHPDGTVLVYDNGGLQNLSPGQYHSRVVEYRIDEANKTATRTFEFPGDFDVDDWYQNHWYTPVWGDADALPNGNVLVTAGMRNATLVTRVFEVTRTGEVVWELTFPPLDEAYRSQRIWPPPLVEEIP